jgi:YidC/Oxa1 family membrane protein insertase
MSMLLCHRLPIRGVSLRQNVFKVKLVAPIHWLANPVTMAERSIVLFQSFAGISWPMTIVSAALCTRLLLFPLAVRQIKVAESIKANESYVSGVRADIQKLRASGQSEVADRRLVLLNKYMKENNCHPIQVLVGFIPLPIYMTLFFAVRRLSESVDFDGFLWITQLSSPDPYMLLPLATSLTLMALIEVIECNHLLL